MITCRNTARIFGENQAAHALEHFVDIERRWLRQPVRRQQAVHQRLQAVGFLHDHLGVFVQARALELVVEQLRGAADAAQRILDFVREIADQFAIGLALIVQALFARDLDLLLDVAKLEQQTLPAGDPAFDFNRRQRAAQVQFRVAGHADFQIVLGIAAVVCARVVDRGAQHAVVFECFCDGIAHEALAAQFK